MCWWENQRSKYLRTHLGHFCVLRVHQKGNQDRKKKICEFLLLRAWKIFISNSVPCTSAKQKKQKRSLLHVSYSMKVKMQITGMIVFCGDANFQKYLKSVFCKKLPDRSQNNFFARFLFRYKFAFCHIKHPNYEKMRTLCYFTVILSKTSLYKIIFITFFLSHVKSRQILDKLDSFLRHSKWTEPHPTNSQQHIQGQRGGRPNRDLELLTGYGASSELKDLL